MGNDSDTTLCFQQVKAVYYNNTPIPDMPVYLFEGKRRSANRLQNLTTDSSGVAAFSLSTANFQGNFHLHVSKMRHCIHNLLANIYKTPNNTLLKVEGSGVQVILLT